jgi:hypothetical protein
MSGGPAQRLVAEAQGVLSVTDEDGRTLAVRRPTALDRLRLLRAVGPVGAQNDRYLGMAMLAACVLSVDGVPLPFPGNEAGVEANVQRLGDSGLAAAARALAPEDEASPAGN